MHFSNTRKYFTPHCCCRCCCFYHCSPRSIVFLLKHKEIFSDKRPRVRHTHYTHTCARTHARAHAHSTLILRHPPPGSLFLKILRSLLTLFICTLWSANSWFCWADRSGCVAERETGMSIRDLRVSSVRPLTVLERGMGSLSSSVCMGNAQVFYIVKGRGWIAADTVEGSIRCL